MTTEELAVWYWLQRATGKTVESRYYDQNGNLTEWTRSVPDFENIVASRYEFRETTFSMLVPELTISPTPAEGGPTAPESEPTAP